MKRLVIMTMLAVLVTSTSFAADTGQAEKVDKAKEAAVQKYLKAAPVDNMLQDAMQIFIQNFPPENRAFIEEAFRSIDRQKIVDVTIASLKKHFTTAEINAVATFYSSKEGKSVMKKMPLLQADITPVIQEAVATALQKVYQETQKKEEE